MKNEDLIQNVSEKTGLYCNTVNLVFDAVFDEIFNSLKRCESVMLKNFGTFYIRDRHGQQVFKFNLSQRLRKLFGWASTYKGDVQGQRRSPLLPQRLRSPYLRVEPVTSAEP